jgi:hypothetical protein
MFTFSRRALLGIITPVLMTVGGLAATPAATDADKPLANQTIHGLVRDIACPLQNKESTARKFNRDCALQCARLGSPLAVLTDDGTMYIPMSESMPDSDQRARLMPFVGKYVSVRGDVYERKGLRSIVIKDIKEDATVKVQGDAFQPE